MVQVAYTDAEAYAAWAGKKLPTEAEWEYAAKGGLENADYAWGDELAPGGTMLANYWQGLFPFANKRLDGWEGTSPVGSFPPNGYGLYDMIGKRLGMDAGLVVRASGEADQALLRRLEPPRGTPPGQL